MSQPNPIKTVQDDTLVGVRKLVVLLVDDQAMVGEGIRRILATEDDIEFHYCEDPANALQMAIDVNATVILQDLVMPDVDGLTLVRFYRNHPETANIPVIVLSSKDDVTVKSEAFANGASDYLVKLPDPIELIARVRAHSKSYLNQIERDVAYQVMSSMQAQLEETNKELEKRNEELQRLSSLDGLTGIANRRRFDEFLDIEWRRASREGKATEISLILIDIDFFKLFNDTYGHQAGDECLKSVAGALAGSLHRATDLAARYGGEEFVVVLVDTPAEGALVVANNIRDAVKELALVHKASEVAESVTVSMGVATLVTEDGSSQENLIANADAALYQAKENGRNCVVLADAEKNAK